MELDKDPHVVAEMFDRISSSYDLLNRILSLSADVSWRERLVDGMSIAPNQMVLDVATGTGDMAIIARTMTGCSVTGLDISPQMMRMAMGKWQKRFSDDRYAPIAGDALQMPFTDSSFDKAMVAFGIRNMVNIASFLDEMHRVLRPGGCLGIVELSVPEKPVIEQAYLAYLTRLLPFVGGLQSGERAAYDYLSTSILKLPPPDKLVRLFEDHGFEVVRSDPMTLGICYLYTMVRK